MTNASIAERDAGANYWNRSLGQGDTLFKNVPVGARFVFRRDEADKDYCILVRTARGYRHEVGGRQFTTGARVGCFVLEA
jgi:hypothetical protein